MSVSRITLVWIAHAGMLVRSIALITTSGVSRDKLYRHYATGHDILHNECVAVLVLSVGEFISIILTGWLLIKNVIQNTRTQIMLLIFLTSYVLVQCYLLIDIVTRTMGNLSKEDEHVNILTVNLCGLGVFVVTTTFQVGIYVYLCVKSEVRHYRTVIQMSHTKLTEPKSFWTIYADADTNTCEIAG